MPSFSRSRSRSPKERRDRARSRSRSRSPRKAADGERRTSNPNANPNLYVANLSYKTTSESLRQEFEAFGEVLRCDVITDPVENVSRGFAFIEFARKEDASDAVDRLHDHEVDGRRIRVEFAKRSGPYNPTPGKYMGARAARARGRDRRDRYDSRRGYDDRSRYGNDRYDRFDGGDSRGSGRDYDDGYRRRRRSRSMSPYRR